MHDMYINVVVVLWAILIAAVVSENLFKAIYV